jgi:hypothetical protein
MEVLLDSLLQTSQRGHRVDVSNVEVQCWD